MPRKQRVIREIVRVFRHYARHVERSCRGLFERHAVRDTATEDHACVALRLTLDELGGMSGR